MFTKTFCARPEIARFIYITSHGGKNQTHKAIGLLLYKKGLLHTPQANNTLSARKTVDKEIYKKLQADPVGFCSFAVFQTHRKMVRLTKFIYRIIRRMRSLDERSDLSVHSHSLAFL